MVGGEGAWTGREERGGGQGRGFRGRWVGKCFEKEGWDGGLGKVGWGKGGLGRMVRKVMWGRWAGKGVRERWVGGRWVGKGGLGKGWVGKVVWRMGLEGG